MKLSSEYLMSDKGLVLLGKLFQSSGEGIMLFNQKGEIEMINPRSEVMFGYSENELIGKPVESLVPRNARKTHKVHRDNYLNSPTPRPMGLGLDLRGLKKDGTTFPIEISLNHLNYENQTMVVAFITDITQRKKNETMVIEQQKKLEEYANELEQKVKIRTRELEHLNLGLQSQIQERKLAENALKKSLEDLKKAEHEILMSLEKEKELGVLKSRFVSMASHEFRTPLTTILSSANLIGKYNEAEQQESRQKHIERINKGVKNLTGILNDFLSLEKLESGVLKPKKDEFEVSNLIQEVVEEMTQTLKKDQEIVHNAISLKVKTDEHVLRNILINLVSNASKYSGEGNKIEINVSNSKKKVTIDVIDSGIGIPKDEQKNMFQRFFRAANATNIEGTGLGLNIVKKYTELIDGELSFISDEGKGSTFTVVFPYA
ncbi:MAG: PAS domain-containing sensor histidine kinase [Cyclobacteriaceae bacterium]